MAAARQAAEGLNGDPCELAIVFASGSHLAAPEATLEGVHEALSPAALVGCGAGGVLGRGREVEDGTAVSVLAVAMEAGRAEPFHAVARPVDDGLVVEGLPSLAGADGVVLVPDPYSFPTDAILADLRDRAPGVPVMGGVSSARTLDGAGALFYGDEIVEDGAVGLRLEGVETLPCVSQGAAPIGPELEITAADGHVIAELEGAPALERLREVIMALEQNKATEFTWPSAPAFFNTMRTHTMEGLFADPIYGGNKDFAGWRLVGFPGAHPAFTPADMQSKESFAGGALIGLQAQAPTRRT